MRTKRRIFNDEGGVGAVRRGRRGTALLVALCLTLPVLTPLAAASAQINLNAAGRRLPAALSRRGQGMNASTKKKLVVLAGAALLYYLYRRSQAKRAEQERMGRRPGTTPVPRQERMPQLYRSRNGGIYYRDPSGRPVWLTAPTRSIEVPYEDVQRYAPDYNRYRGRPAPSIPSGARRESFEDFDGSLFSGSSYTPPRRGASGGGGGNSTTPPGPRR